MLIHFPKLKNILDYKELRKQLAEQFKDLSSGEFQIKIADFGCSKIAKKETEDLNNDKLETQSTNTALIHYGMRANEMQTGKYNCDSDVFGIGVIAYYLMTHKLMFKYNDQQ